MSLESGEHSDSMLLVLSLWALEFCLSFMEVLRGRLCSLFSTLLRRQQAKNKIYDSQEEKKEPNDPVYKKSKLTIKVDKH